MKISCFNIHIEVAKRKTKFNIKIIFEGDIKNKNIFFHKKFHAKFSSLSTVRKTFGQLSMLAILNTL